MWRVWNFFKGLSDFERAQIRHDAMHEAADYVEKWRRCDCGQTHGLKTYSTFCGHAVNCPRYITASIRELADFPRQTS
jgi:hypothetical protein